MKVDLKKHSPLGVYIEHCKKGELAYQRSPDGAPIFFPRAVAPTTGAELEWSLSKGRGTVYATTAVHATKDQPPYNVSLIDLDEGFRMMSRVDGIAALEVCVGMRVKVTFTEGDDKQPPYPIFKPLEAA